MGSNTDHVILPTAHNVVLANHLRIRNWTLYRAYEMLLASTLVHVLWGWVSALRNLRASSTSHPRGNQVDGLPRAASNMFARRRKMW